MHRPLIAAAAAIALLLPTVAAACGVPLRPSSTRVIEDDTPPCLTVSGLEGREMPALDVINECPEAVTLRNEPVNGHLGIAGQDSALQIAVEPGTSVEVLLALAVGEYSIEWSAGEQSGRIIYIMDFDSPPDGCPPETGCAVTLGAPAPPGSGWLALGLVVLIGLYRARRRVEA